MRTAGIDIDETDASGEPIFHTSHRKSAPRLVPLSHSAVYRDARRWAAQRMMRYGWSNDLLVPEDGAAPIDQMDDTELLSVYAAAIDAHRIMSDARDAHAAALLASTPAGKAVVHPDRREPMAEAMSATLRTGLRHEAISERIAEMAGDGVEDAVWLSLQCRDACGPWSARGIKKHLGIDPDTLRTARTPRASIECASRPSALKERG